MEGMESVGCAVCSVIGTWRAPCSSSVIVDADAMAMPCEGKRGQRKKGEQRKNYTHVSTHEARSASHPDSRACPASPHHVETRCAHKGGQGDRPSRSVGQMLPMCGRSGGGRELRATDADVPLLTASTVPRQAEPDLLTRIKSDLKDAMRAKDSFTSTVLRVCRRGSTGGTAEQH